MKNNELNVHGVFIKTKEIIDKYGYIKDLETIEDFENYLRKRFLTEKITDQSKSEIQGCFMFFKENLIVKRGGMLNFHNFEPEIKKFILKKECVINNEIIVFV